jgi:uncharacterized delta-60 repeat protein
MYFFGMMPAGLRGWSASAVVAGAAAISTATWLGCNALAGIQDGVLASQDAAPADSEVQDGGGNDGPSADGLPDVGADAPAPGTFSASVSPASVLLRAGATAQVTVTAQRNAFSAPITVTASGLPAHVTAATATIPSPPAAQTATITLTADAMASAGASAQASFTAKSGTTTVSAGTVTVTVAGPSGTLDTSWPKMLPFGAGLGTIDSALVQPDGKLLVFGTFHATAGDAPALVLRLNQDGSTDTTFQTHAIGTSASASPLADGIKGILQADGKILVAWTQGSNSVLNITRLKPDGSLDGTWNNPNTATVSTGLTFASATPQIVVPIALQLADGSLVFSQGAGSGSNSGFQVFRFTNAGVPDPSIGGTGTPGSVYLQVATPALSLTSSNGVFPQTNGSLYFIGSGVGGMGFSGQLTARTTQAVALDTTYGSGGTGWDWTLRGSQSLYDTVMIGSTIYGAIQQQVTPCMSGSAVSMCASAWTVAGTSSTTYACPDVSTGLSCSDVGVRITPGPNGTLLVGGFSSAAGGIPVVASFTQAPFAANASFGTNAVTKLRGSATDMATESPVAIVSTPDGFTIVFTHDTTYPMQRLWP